MLKCSSSYDGYLSHVLTHSHIFALALDRVSTIALFPTTMDTSRASGIRQAFEIMQRKFNRPQNLLKEVSADAIVDFMYGYPPNTEGGGATHGGGGRAAQPVSGPPPLQSIQNRTSHPASVNSAVRTPGQVTGSYFCFFRGLESEAEV